MVSILRKTNGLGHAQSILIYTFSEKLNIRKIVKDSRLKSRSVYARKYSVQLIVQGEDTV
jgi:hypothetical protein